jgi:hypothetical protein
MHKDLIKEYLAHSYLYYVLAETIIDDYTFDAMCRDINKNWDMLASPYKEFLIANNNIPPIKGLELWEEDYPEEIREYAEGLLR